MKVSLEQVENIAKLARIYLTDQEKEKLSKELSKILSYVEKINELDTSNIEPTAHILDIHNVFREDIVKDSMPVKEVTDLAPKHQDNFIVVPKVI
jgi:aspartyl-tRNA(Asn)/glutamyl-tRNA(Gln) amidotransferase subunit C